MKSPGKHSCCGGGGEGRAGTGGGREATFPKATPGADGPMIGTVRMRRARPRRELGLEGGRDEAGHVHERLHLEKQEE